MDDQLKKILSVSEGEKFEYDPSLTWVDLFLAQVKEHPQQIAVEDEEGTLTYRELNEASDRIAGYLLSSGLKPDEFIGVRMSRNKGFSAVTLGIHKAGGAYVPIDLDYPPERVTYMLADSETRIIMNDETAADAVRTGAPLSPDQYRCRPDSSAYMIYTSGSTGRPKGVMIQHKALLNFVHFIRERWHLTSDSRIACHSNFAFDASVEDLYPVLTAGGTLVIVPEEIRKDIFEMRDFIQKRQITGGCYSTRFGQILAMDHELDVSYICLGGEAMTSVPKVTGSVYNTYGPTEFTVDATYFELEKGKEYNPIPIGRPLYNCAAFIMDENLELLPLGEIGELCLSGPQLALGYWKRPDLTAEKFTEARIAEGDVRKIYRTGDLARYNEEGQLEFCGRGDSQVKLRGFRIELEEVESAALKYPGIRQAAADVRKDTLCLYYTAEKEIDENALKEFMARTLTDYMLPGWFGRMEKMPETPNGKLDRKALPEPVMNVRKTPYEAPTNDTERKLCSAMEEVLGAEDNTIGIHDDFFELGGDSIKAMMVMSLAGLEGLSARMIFRYKTPAAIAEDLSALKADDMRAYEAEARMRKLPAHRGQILMIDDQFEAVRSCMYNLSCFYRIGAKLDPRKLAEAVDAAVQQHPGLCSAFDFDEEGNIILYTRPDFPGKTEVAEITREEMEKLPETLQQPFTLFGKPLFRSKVYCCGDEIRLFLDMHHTVSDGTSISVLLTDIAKAYWGEEMVPDYFYSYLRKEHEGRGTAEFRKAWKYFRDLLGNTDWCRIPTPDFETVEPDCASEFLENVMTTRQMEEAEKRTGYSRNVIAIAAVMMALREYCGRDEICVDYINNNRIEKYLQSTVGLVYKTLPVAVELNRYPDPEHLLPEVNRQVIDSFVNSICDYQAEVATMDEDCIAVNYVAELGSAENLKGFEAEEIHVGQEDDTMGGHADLYFEENEGMVTLHLDYLKQAYKKENMQAFIRLCAKTLKQITGVNE